VSALARSCTIFGVMPPGSAKTISRQRAWQNIDGERTLELTPREAAQGRVR
jgi:hypothetical protein